MYKIKDNVDLKELERFGYELEEDWYNRPTVINNNDIKGEYIYWKNVALYTSIEIEVKTRRIFQRYDDILETINEKYIDDLIKADLV